MIGDDIEVFAQRQILEHGGDAEVERRAGAGQRHLVAGELDGAR
jgi:hypothetical protein